MSYVYVAVVAADLLPTWSQAITAIEVVADGIVIVPPEDRPVPETQSAGAVAEVPDAVAYRRELASAAFNSALNAVLKVFEAGKTGAPGAVVSTIKVLVAAGAGDSFPAVSVAVPFRISILMVPLPVKLFKVTVRVTVPLVSVPET